MSKKNLKKFHTGPTKKFKGKHYKTMAGHRSFGLISGLTAIGGLIASAAGAAKGVKDLVDSTRSSSSSKKNKKRIISSRR